MINGFAFNEWVGLHLVASAVMLLVIIAMLRFDAKNPLTRLSVGFCMTLLIWALIKAGMRGAESAEWVLRLARYEYAVVAVVSAQMYQAILQQFYAQDRAALGIMLGWILGAGLAFAVLATPWVITGTWAGVWGLEPELGALGWGIIGLQALMLLHLDYEYLRALRATVAGTTERKRYKALGVMMGMIHLGPLDFFYAATGWGLPLTFLTISAFAVSVAVVSIRFGVMDVSLRRQSEAVMDQAVLPTLLVATDGQVVQLNQPAAQLMGGKLVGDLKGQFVSELLGARLSGFDLRVQQAKAPEDRAFEMQLTPLGSIEAPIASFDPVLDEGGDVAAWRCVLVDQSDLMSRLRDDLEQASTDPQTGLLSRQAFLGMMQTPLRQQHRAGQFSLMLVVVGNYKRLIRSGSNDRAQVALVQLVRAVVDTVGNRGLVCRFGDDEILVALPSAGEAVDACALIDPLTAQGAMHMHIGLIEDGLALGNREELVRAVARLRRQSEESAGISTTYQPARHAEEDHLESDLRKAIRDGELRLFYQPVVDWQSGRPTGFEALIRWQHPRRGLVFPGDFVEFAESIGLSDDIDRFVVAQAAKDVRVFRSLAPDWDLRVNVNLTQQRLTADNALRDLLEPVLAAGIQPGYPQIEVLEDAAIQDDSVARLNELARGGFRLCLDDFGTGYSSFGRLFQVPAQVLKIDRSLILALQADGDLRLIESILQIASELNLKVIAEGVDRIDEIQQLANAGCRYFQGFYFAKAVERSEVLKWLDQQQMPWQPNVAEDASRSA